jgi:hypothetical protein
MTKNIRLSVLVLTAVCGLLLAQGVAQGASQDPPPRQAPPPAQAPVQAPPVQAAPPPQTIEIPPGTPIYVRTIQAIDSRTADVNREYAASLAEPLMANGMQVAPRNADVRLRVIEDKKAGAVSGRTTLVLQVAAVRINGQMVYVDTGTTVKESQSQGAKTATRGIVGGILGAGIGAIAGGGKGAAIGAGAGGAAGVASAMISGEQVRVKPETRLDFTLSQSVQVPAPPQGAPPPANDFPQRMAPPEQMPPPQLPPPSQPPGQPLGEPMTSYRVDGWIVSVRYCYLNREGRMDCNLTIANERREREISILGDSTITDLDGNRQRAVEVCPDRGRCAPDWARMRVFPGSAVNVRLNFGTRRLTRPVDRMNVVIRWQGGEESVELRGFRVDGYR